MRRYYLEEEEEEDLYYKNVGVHLTSMTRTCGIPLHPLTA
jgi:hypothetical protein